MNKWRSDLIDFVKSKKYGQWTALEVAEYNTDFMGKETYWCQCDCGHKQKIIFTLLKDFFKHPRCKKCYKRKSKKKMA